MWNMSRRTMCYRKENGFRRLTNDPIRNMPRRTLRLPGGGGVSPSDKTEKSKSAKLPGYDPLELLQECRVSMAANTKTLLEENHQRWLLCKAHTERIKDTSRWETITGLGLTMQQLYGTGTTLLNNIPFYPTQGATEKEAVPSLKPERTCSHGLRSIWT